MRPPDYPPNEVRSLTRPVRLEEGQALHLGDLELRDRLPLGGRVLDHEGRPVAGLKLTATCGDVEHTVQTDGSGRFEFPELAVSYWNLTGGPAARVYPGDLLEYRLEPPTSRSGRSSRR